MLSYLQNATKGTKKQQLGEGGEGVAQTDKHCKADKATDDVRKHTVNSPLYVIHPIYRIKEGKTSNEMALKTLKRR